MDCLANMVAEVVEYIGKVVITVNETTHEPEPAMALKIMTPTTQLEARLSEISNTEKQETFDEVCYEDGM